MTELEYQSRVIEVGIRNLIKDPSATQVYAQYIDRMVFDLCGIPAFCSKSLASKRPLSVIAMEVSGSRGDILVRLFSRSLTKAREEIITLLLDTARCQESLMYSKSLKKTYEYLRNLYVDSIKRLAALIGSTEMMSADIKDRYKVLNGLVNGASEDDDFDDDDDDDDEKSENPFKRLTPENLKKINANDQKKVDEMLANVEKKIGRSLTNNEISAVINKFFTSPEDDFDDDDDDDDDDDEGTEVFTQDQILLLSRIIRHEQEGTIEEIRKMFGNPTVPTASKEPAVFTDDDFDDEDDEDVSFEEHIRRSVNRSETPSNSVVSKPLVNKESEMMPLPSYEKPELAPDSADDDDDEPMLKKSNGRPVRMIMGETPKKTVIRVDMQEVRPINEVTETIDTTDTSLIIPMKKVSEKNLKISDDASSTEIATITDDAETIIDSDTNLEKGELIDIYNKYKTHTTPDSQDETNNVELESELKDSSDTNELEDNSDDETIHTSIDVEESKKFIDSFVLPKIEEQITSNISNENVKVISTTIKLYPSTYEDKLYTLYGECVVDMDVDLSSVNMTESETILATAAKNLANQYNIEEHLIHTKLSVILPTQRVPESLMMSSYSDNIINMINAFIYHVYTCENHEFVKVCYNLERSDNSTDKLVIGLNDLMYTDDYEKVDLAKKYQCAYEALCAKFELTNLAIPELKDYTGEEDDIFRTNFFTLNR